MSMGELGWVQRLLAALPDHWGVWVPRTRRDSVVSDTNRSSQLRSLQVGQLGSRAGTSMAWSETWTLDDAKYRTLRRHATGCDRRFTRCAKHLTAYTTSCSHCDRGLKLGRAGDGSDWQSGGGEACQDGIEALGVGFQWTLCVLGAKETPQKARIRLYLWMPQLPPISTRTSFIHSRHGPCKRWGCCLGA